MDPNIVKLLEEDEDETMHSGADVEAFTAALNRDIEGNTGYTSDSDSTSNYSVNKPASHWHNSSQDELTTRRIPQDLMSQRQAQHVSELAANRLHKPATHIQSELAASRLQNSATQIQRVQNHVGESMYKNSQRTVNQQTMPAQNVGNNTVKVGKQVSFGHLLPVIAPQLDKDKRMQLETLYEKLRANEVPKEGFVRLMRNIVGDQMLKMAVYKLQSQAVGKPQTGPSQLPQTTSQVQPKGNFARAEAPRNTPAVPQQKVDPRNAVSESIGQTPQDMERNSDVHGKHVNQMTSSSMISTDRDRERPSFPIQGLNKQQQQHLHFSQGSFPVYGNPGGNYRSFPGANVNSPAPASSVQQQAVDPRMRQGPIHQNIGGSHLGTSNPATNMLAAAKLERQNMLIEQKRNNFNSDQQQKPHSATRHGLSSFTPLQDEHGNTNVGVLEMQSSRAGASSSMSAMLPSPAPRSITAQLNSQIPPVISPGAPVNDAKPPLKKPFVGQKKQLESIVSSPPLASKKQKVSGSLADQSIEQLNDVTAVSGVNLREEEEQLFSGSKEDARVSEASRRVVQEEEERLLLQKIPLQNKLAEIMSRCGVKSMSNDVERCLSLSVEERMRGLISSLIRLSKQRVDIEKSRHRTIVTSDVRKQIMAINQKAREEWDKKQSEAEKLLKINDPEGIDGVDGDKEKEYFRGKLIKQQPQVNKDEDDKMRTTAANVAARAAVGGDDMLSKWQQMAEQARQKREGGSDMVFTSHQGKDVSHKPASSLANVSKDNQEFERSGQQNTAAIFGSRKSSRSQSLLPHNKVVRSISVKDVIAVLEREPQMSKGQLIYRLYEKTSAVVEAD